jgi:hypothetical protein
MSGKRCASAIPMRALAATSAASAACTSGRRIRVGRHARRDVRRQDRVVHRPAARHVAGKAAEQDRDEILGLGDLALELRDGGGGDRLLDLRLPARRGPRRCPCRTRAVMMRR